MKGLQIKKIRKDSGLTQKEFAKSLNVSIASVQKWESGERTPTEQMSFFIKNKYNVGVDNNNSEAIPVSFDQFSIMMVPLVNQYAYAGYLNGFGDEEYIDELPKIPFAADREHKGEYLCFEVRGDSMDDGSYESYLEGDILLCRNVRQDLWKSKLHIRKWNFVIVHKERGILVKKIVNHDVEKGIITLHSLNDFYEDFNVHLNDVAKIFNIVESRRKESRR